MNKRIALISVILIFFILLPIIKVNSTPVYYGNFNRAILLESNELIRKWSVDNNTHNNNTVSTWTSGNGVNSILSLISDSNYIYAGGYASPGKVSKIDKSTMLTVSTWTSGDGVNGIRGLTSDSNYIYAGGDVSPGKVSKIDKSTMLTVSTWTSGDGVNYIRGLTSDSNYIYAGGDVSPGKVSKIDLSLKIYYEIWEGAVRVYYSMVEPDINDFITITLPVQIAEPTSMTFTQWMILLFITLGISLLAAIKFHIIATVSLILVLYMVINVASFTGIILLAIIVWLLTIMFSIMAFAEI